MLLVRFQLIPSKGIIAQMVEHVFCTILNNFLSKNRKKECMLSDDKYQEVIDLWISKKQRKRWERMAEILGLTIYEYIRRCADAHTTILETDSFKLVDDKK